jgi:hypothetical protein
MRRRGFGEQLSHASPARSAVDQPVGTLRSYCVSRGPRDSYRPFPTGPPTKGGLGESGAPNRVFDCRFAQRPARLQLCRRAIARPDITFGTRWPEVTAPRSSGEARAPGRAIMRVRYASAMRPMKPLSP